MIFQFFKDELGNIFLRKMDLTLTRSIKNTRFLIGFGCPCIRISRLVLKHSTLADIIGVFFKAHVLEKKQYFNHKTLTRLN